MTSAAVSLHGQLLPAAHLEAHDHIGNGDVEQAALDLVGVLHHRHVRPAGAHITGAANLNSENLDSVGRSEGLAVGAWPAENAGGQHE